MSVQSMVGVLLVVLVLGLTIGYMLPAAIVGMNPVGETSSAAYDSISHAITYSIVQSDGACASSGSLIFIPSYSNSAMTVATPTEDECMHLGGISWNPSTQECPLRRYAIPYEFSGYQNAFKPVLEVNLACGPCVMQPSDLYLAKGYSQWTYLYWNEASDFGQCMAALTDVPTFNSGSVVIDLDGPEECFPDWQCSAWGTCVDSIQTRVCTDVNACGVDAGKPAESRACEVEPPPLYIPILSELIAIIQGIIGWFFSLFGLGGT